MHVYAMRRSDRLRLMRVVPYHMVFVADPGLGNILNFAVGSNIDLDIPPNFWTRLAGGILRTSTRPTLNLLFLLRASL